MRIIAQNRKARFDYFIEETLEAGIVLTGSEVKSLRMGKASIVDAFGGEMKGELYLMNAHIPEYERANRFNHTPRRPRKLLVHKRQMERLLGKVKTKGLAIVVLSLYLTNKNIVKAEIALARGKKSHDKRESIKERDWAREKSRTLRE